MSSDTSLSRLGVYRIESSLGKGGMGEVLLAWDERLKRHVAIKRIRGDKILDGNHRARLRREAQVVARLNHPAIVQVYDILERDDGDCIVMERVEGRTLKEILAEGRLELPLVIKLATEIADGLAEAHDKGLVHRDLKPGNVIVTPSEHAKILDFGITRILKKAGEGDVTAATLTTSGMVVGTVTAMSPEQAAGMPVDHRSDLFALGGLIYEMVTGRVPFQGKDVLDTMRRVMIEEPQPIQELVPETPPELVDLLARLLAKDCHHRPQDTHQVVTELERIARLLTGSRPAAPEESLSDLPTLAGAYPVPAKPEPELAIRVLVQTQLIDSTKLTESLGETQSLNLLRSHDRAARDLLADFHGREIDKTTGFFFLFDRPADAVAYALAYQEALARLTREQDVTLEAGVGVHLDEVSLRPNDPADVARGAKPIEVEGLAKPVVARLTTLAGKRQILMTHSAFDLARRAAADGALADQSICWLAHGAYAFEDVEEPVNVFEVGVEGFAPLSVPADSQQARRMVAHGDELTLGWRPAVGQPIPTRSRWILEERLGAGGFGEVWLAAHKSRERRVFKFCYDPASLRTLQREITLFRLLKENLGNREDISRIIDWSFDEAPYFVESEYTDGGNLVDWATEQGGLAQLPLELRLEIVAQVATALAAAHSVGVLHKDVKPTNVLIATDRNGQPQAKLSDFGIGAVTEAKRLAEADITALGITASIEESSTRGSYTGTRLYMAPEVLEGKSATLHSDIYALGLMLYQIVVGDFSLALAPGWRRAVDDELLREDIALAVDGSPERRLGDALRLAERLRDLEGRRQKLADERRAAEEKSRLRAALDRTHKRRRLWAAVIVVLILFGGAMTAMMFRVRDEAERTERAADFLAELFEVTDPLGFSDPDTLRSPTMTVRELIDRGRDRLRTDFEDDPRTRSRLMGTLGRIYQHLGQFDEAEPLLQEGLTLRRQALGDEHPEVAESLHDVADLLRSRGDHAGAQTLFHEALEMRRRLLGKENLGVVHTLNRLGLSYRESGDYERAEPLLREALDISQRLWGQESIPAAYNLNSVAVLLRHQGEYAEAEPLFREALEIKRRLLGDDHPTVATTLVSLASLLRTQGDYAAAEPLYREALEIRKKALGDDHPAVASSLNSLALLLRDLGDYAAAEPLFREALEMKRRQRGDHPTVASSLNSLAMLLRDQGDTADAERLFREALEMKRQLMGNDHRSVAATLKNLAWLLVAQGQSAQAEPLIREAQEIYRQALPPGHWSAADAEGVLGAVFAAQGNFREAESMLTESLRAVHDGTGQTSTYTRLALERLIFLYEAWGKPAKAAEYRALWVEAGGVLQGTNS